MIAKKFIKPIFCLALAISVSSCGYPMHEPTNVTSKRVEIKRENFSKTYTADSINDAMLKKMADDYYRYGDNGIDVVVFYDPKSKINTAMEATREGARISNDLRVFGVKDVNVKILPVKDSGSDSSVLISYDRVTAHKPEECGDLVGFNGKGTNLDKKSRNDGYEYGCEIEGLIAKQIARPRDLMGNDTKIPGEGRRSSNMSESYLDDTPNQPLNGETASGN